MAETTGTVTYPLGPDTRESLGGTLVLSVVLHGLLFISAFVYTMVGPRLGKGWGQSWATGSAIHVNAVASLPSVPLPEPMQTTPSTVATDNPGLYKNEPKPEPVTKTPETKIPKFKEEAKPERTVRVNTRIQKEPLAAPENAVPFGVGGKPSMTYAQLANSAGDGGLSFGEGNFGERYSWYVSAVRNRISSNWLMTTVSPNIQTAPRIYLDFDILRDGTITNVQIIQSSEIPEVDRSALRAVLASNPLGPLPPEYAGNKVSVHFYFDFHRR